MKYLILLSTFFLCSCSGIHTGNAPFDAVVTSTAAAIRSDGASLKCEQGHAQDRVNCRKRKQSQVDAINRSIKNHTDK